MIVNEKSSPGDDLFLSFECAPIADWRDWVIEPTPPKNYVKEEAISKWMERALLELQTKAAQSPLSGEVLAAVVLDHHGNVVVRGTGAEIYNWLCLHLNLRRGGSPLRLWAIDGRKLLHLCAMDAAKAGLGALTKSWGLYLSSFMSVPAQVRECVEVYDPVRLLLRSEGDAESQTELLKEYMTQHVSLSAEFVYEPGELAHAAKFVLDVWRTFGLDRPLLYDSL